MNKDGPFYPDFERLLEQGTRESWNTENVNGAISICPLGCYPRHWLVVTGRKQGHIRGDERADEGGIFPLSTMAKRRSTFG
jgi:hypothetical protein